MKLSHISIFPSIMCCKPWDFPDYIRAFEQTGVDGIHFDVMDGHYVPNVMLGVSDFDAIRSITSLPLDVHLMCTEPERYPSYFKLREGDLVSFHPETATQPYRMLQDLKSKGIKAGLAMGPGIPVSYIEECLGVLDFVMVMAVNPGFAGQVMVPDHLDKLRRIREITEKADHPVALVIDGNTTPANARRMLAAGATGFVTGTSSMLKEGAASFQRLYEAYLSALQAND